MSVVPEGRVAGQRVLVVPYSSKTWEKELWMAASLANVVGSRWACSRSKGCGIVEWPYEEVHDSQEQRHHMLQMVDHVVECVKVSVQVVSVGCPACTARCSLGRP